MAHKKHPHRQSLPPKTARSTSSHTALGSGGHWVYGWHAVMAALVNPERVVLRIIVSPQAAERLKLPVRKLPTPHIMEAREVDRILGADAVHQGIGAEVRPLEPYVLEDVIHAASGTLLILDQVSDPHNVGAMMRSAAAYDALAVIVPKDHSAPETATMAKAASGALDVVKRVQVVNLATAMRELKAAGWWIIGLEGEAKTLLPAIKPSAKTVLVLGAEGKGMRRLTAECCDETARLPMGPRMESLNVSNAAAIALYQLYMSKHHA